MSLSNKHFTVWANSLLSNSKHALYAAVLFMVIIQQINCTYSLQPFQPWHSMVYSIQWTSKATKPLKKTTPIHHPIYSQFVYSFYSRVILLTDNCQIDREACNDYPLRITTNVSQHDRKWSLANTCLTMLTTNSAPQLLYKNYIPLPAWYRDTFFHIFYQQLA